MTTSHLTMEEPTNEEYEPSQHNVDGTSGNVLTDQLFDVELDGNENAVVTATMSTSSTSSSMSVTTDRTTRRMDAVQNGNQRMTASDDFNNVDNSTSPTATFFMAKRLARFVARNPRSFLASTFSLSLAMAAFGMLYGKFALVASTDGWTTRGTTIADRQTQSILVRRYRQDLLYGDSDVWDDLTQRLQPSWGPSQQTTTGNGNDDNGKSDNKRRLKQRRTLDNDQGNDRNDEPIHVRQMSRQTTQEEDTELQLIQLLNETSDALNGCNAFFYPSPEFAETTHLWSVWEPREADASILSPASLYDVCIAEENTQRLLEQEGLCYGCEQGDGCVPPYSLVLLIRMFVVPGGMNMTCDELSDSWQSYHPSFEQQVIQCVSDIKSKRIHENEGIATRQVDGLPLSCPPLFHPSLVDGNADVNMLVSYGSSIFATDEYHNKKIFRQDLVDRLDRGGEAVQGFYDTQDQDFVVLYQDEVLASDVTLAMGSAIVVIIAIMTHTKSPFITFVGLLQIVLSFPLAFLVYKIVAGIDFFPFLNFISVFVVFALGADDIFIAMDKWKNARLEHPQASTETIAAIALPDAAGAMLLTTATTSVAFFATAICPVASVKLFAIFCGLLVTLDYVLCILLVFPSLCIYDIHLQSKGVQERSNCCIALQCTVSKPSTNDDVDDDHDGDKRDLERSPPTTHKEDDVEMTERVPNQIQRFLAAYYDQLHRFRWPLLAICTGVFGLCVYYTTTMKLPDTLEVQLLPKTIQFEQNRALRQNLLDGVLTAEIGSNGYIFWGVTPADTGNHNDPSSFSSLVLDDTFDPSSEGAQVFLLEFCDRLYAEEFASEPTATYSCPMQSFDSWLKRKQQPLQQQQKTDVTDADGSEEFIVFLNNCGNTTGVPVPENYFHSCMTLYAQDVGNNHVLSRNGQVKILFFKVGVRYDSEDDYFTLKDEFFLMEGWMRDNMAKAPDGVNGGFFVASDLWYYDTHKAMLDTAYGSAAIALVGSSLVILFSSRSLSMTIFASLSIMYVLASVTATMVAFGWNFGFLEAICFAILIGLSADFVTHFAHAYASQSGGVIRGKRVKFAIVHMGPSILAASFTTISGAIIMLFTTIVFFQKFAFVMFFSIVQATVGAFVFFCVMTDCFGPSDPTLLVDTVIKWLMDFGRRHPRCAAIVMLVLLVVPVTFLVVTLG